MQPILQAHNLSKSYKGKPAVKRVSFELRPGEIVGLLGPNGAGKTTTIQLLLSLLEPDEGTIEMFGKDLMPNREAILSKMNFVSPYSWLPSNLTPRENLTVYCLLYDVPNVRETVRALLEEFRLGDLANTSTGKLSSGEQTRLGIAKALINNPRILLLDEPTASLDPAAARWLRGVIKERVITNNGAALWTSHNMAEVELVCDRVILMFHGEIVADAPVEKLREQFQKERLEDIFIALAKNDNPLSI